MELLISALVIGIDQRFVGVNNTKMIHQVPTNKEFSLLQSFTKIFFIFLIPIDQKLFLAQ